MSDVALDRGRVLSGANVTLPARSVQNVWRGLVGVGVLLCAVAVLVGAFAEGDDPTIASASLHSLHAGFLAALAFPIGALGFVMMLHLVKAGWAGTIRRQFENIMSLFPVAAAMFLTVVALQFVFVNLHEAGHHAPYLWDWMNPAHAHDGLLLHKQGFLNPIFFAVRAVIYFAVWLGLAKALFGLSRRQDEDGDRWHTVTAVRLSAPGILLFGFTTAFASFDWMMALDYHWFSTMFGVYFFAISMTMALALGLIALIGLRGVGRLHVAFTHEHLHDLTKLLFAFLVFWGYVGFSQYFLIWYGNIPEETAFFALRKGELDVPGAEMWRILSWFVPIAKFIVPFIILVPRPLRRRPALVAAMCVWVIAMNLVELYWMIRPEAGAGFAPLADIAGVLGPVLIMGGFFLRRVAMAPLVAINDPRMDEALHHRNTI